MTTKEIPDARLRALLDLIKLYCRVLDTGIKQCGFESDKVARSIFMEKSVNKVFLDESNLRSAYPPEIPKVIVNTSLMFADDIAVATIEGTVRIVEEALSFETDDNLRQLIFLLACKIALADDESGDEFAKAGETIRQYYDCGKRMMRFIDQLVQRIMEVNIAVLKSLPSEKVCDFVQKNCNAQSIVLRELCCGILPFISTN